MFEDLIIEKNEDVMNRTTSSRCPYCGSYYIHRYKINAMLDDRYKQKVKCSCCQREWELIFSADMNEVNISNDVSSV